MIVGSKEKNGVDNGKQFAKEIETLCQIAKKPNQIVSASSIFSKSLQKEISNIWRSLDSRDGYSPKGRGPI